MRAGFLRPWRCGHSKPQCRSEVSVRHRRSRWEQEQGLKALPQPARLRTARPAAPSPRGAGPTTGGAQPAEPWAPQVSTQTRHVSMSELAYLSSPPPSSRPPAACPQDVGGHPHPHADLAPALTWATRTVALGPRRAADRTAAHKVLPGKGRNPCPLPRPPGPCPPHSTPPGKSELQIATVISLLALPWFFLLYIYIYIFFKKGPQRPLCSAALTEAPASGESCLPRSPSRPPALPPSAPAACSPLGLGLPHFTLPSAPALRYPSSSSQFLQCPSHCLWNE